MTIEVTNTYQYQVSVSLDTAAGKNTDAVHIMPYATVKLPLGSTVSQNALAAHPRLVIVDTQQAG